MSTFTDHLDRHILIHICRDGTISYRTRKQRIFNNVALPVFSVDTVEQAQELQVRFGRLQYVTHPDMKKGERWYKLSTLPNGQDLALRRGGTLELDDLPAITEMFNKWYEATK